MTCHVPQVCFSLYVYLVKQHCSCGPTWYSLPVVGSAGNISNKIDIDRFRANLVNAIRNGNVQVMPSSIATNQARGGSGACNHIVLKTN